MWGNYGINSFTNIFVGHIGDIELSAVAIASSVVSNFSFGFLLGMASALETLCRQAFGAGQIDLLGVYIQRSWIILFGACFALLPLYLYATPILRLLGLEPDIADIAGAFTMQVIPQMFSLPVNFQPKSSYRHRSQVGYYCAAAAYDISAWAIAVAQVVYVVGWCKEGWTGLSCVRVSNELGSAHPRAAKYSVFVTSRLHSLFSLEYFQQSLSLQLETNLLSFLQTVKRCERLRLV
ncbi:hypothetical protein REPUB_Repub17cG0156700 [Reevesia pubescens]